MPLASLRKHALLFLGVGFGAYLSASWPRVAAADEADRDIPGKFVPANIATNSAITVSMVSFTSVASFSLMQPPLPNPVTECELDPSSASSRYYEDILRIAGIFDTAASLSAPPATATAKTGDAVAARRGARSGAGTRAKAPPARSTKTGS